MFKEFIDAAQQFVDQIHYKHAQFDREEEQLRERLNEIEDERSNLAKVDTCMDSYKSCGCNYPCPECFVTKGRVVEMTPLGSEDNSEMFRCGHCNLEIQVEV